MNRRLGTIMKAIKFVWWTKLDESYAKRFIPWFTDNAIAYTAKPNAELFTRE